MSETALKFGPEWLRALSHGGASSPPPSPGPVKFKMAEFRYGREEMLALFSKDYLPPEEMHSLGSLCLDEVQEPLAFLPMNAEEQRMWQRGVNSEAVLRGTGRAPINGVGRGRGGSIERGRGRGRGVGAPYYSRGLSYDEETEVRSGPREGGPPGMSTRGKGYERSQSIGESRVWNERVATERGPPPGAILEDRSGATSPRKEQNRAANVNWRSRASEEDGDRWKGLSNTNNRTDKWGSRNGWREREGAENDWEDRGGQSGNPLKVSRPPWEMERDKSNHRRAWEDDNLPEWATEEMEEKGGSFDAAGAYHAPGSSDEGEAVNENEANIDARGNFKEKGESSNSPQDPADHWPDNQRSEYQKEIPIKKKEIYMQEKPLEKGKDLGNSHIQQSSHMVNGILSEGESSTSPSPPHLQSNQRKLRKPFGSSLTATEVNKEAQVEEENLDHMQSVADDLVAKLVEEDEPTRPLSKHLPRIHQPPPPGGFIPQSDSLPSTEEHWYYTDPQGDIQGPFTSSDMAAWYKAGYFKPNLLLRRQCDDKFAQLGDLTRVFGRVPFLPGPAVPPLKVSELLNAQKAERERLEMIHLQNQLYQQQVSMRQQQVYQQLQNLEEWSTLSAGQQQKLFMNYYMALPPLVPPNNPLSLSQSASLASTSSSVTTAPRVPATGDARTNLSSSSSATSLSQAQDPIQAFVAQMNSTKNVPGGTNSESTVASSSLTPPTDSVSVGGSPLQKLLHQLQLGSLSSTAAPTRTINSSSTSSAHSSHTQGLVGANSSSSLTLEKPDQFDPIQSLMNQLSQIQSGPLVSDSVQQQDDNQQREEEQKRIEEERKLFEKQKKVEEERIKQQEHRLQEERQREEGRRKELEDRNQRLEEELRRIQVESKRNQEVVDKQKKEEEIKRIQMEQQKAAADVAKKEEDQKRHQKLKQKQEEENRRKEETAARKQEQERERLVEERRKKEERRKAEEEKKKQEEEKQKREEKERQQRQQLQIQEELRKMAVEEEKKRMHKQIKEEEKKRAALEEQERRAIQQALQERLKQVPPAWSNMTAEKGPAAPSLAEIQKTQEIKEKKEREAESMREAQRQKEAALKQAAEEKKQQENSNKWGSRSSQSGGKKGPPPTSNSSAPPPVKSLIEIQKEEEKELKKKLEKEQAERAAAVSHLSLNAAGVWGSAVQSLSWANRASTGASIGSAPQGSHQSWSGITASSSWSNVAQTNSNNPLWNHETGTSNTSGGFWESPDPIKTSKSAANIVGSSNPSRSPPKPAPAQPQQQQQQPQPQQQANKASAAPSPQNTKAMKKKPRDETENVRKLTGENATPSDNFKQWCKSSLHAMKVQATIDIPTFVGFLSDVESPYEVHDYIRSYLGDSKEVKEFAKQYLERRSRARNAYKMRQEEDNILAPAPAVNPVSNQEFQEVKTRLKKGNRKKMQKVDNSILGFNVATKERMNVEGN